MRKIRYGVAMSLDGYIAGPKGEADWIVSDPKVNFAEIWAQFDTLLMGRRTYDAAKARLGETALQGVKTIVVSRTLRHAPEVTIISELNRDRIEALRAQAEKISGCLAEASCFALCWQWTRWTRSRWPLCR
jgi:dihydrofolate reductase